LDEDRVLGRLAALEGAALAPQRLEALAQHAQLGLAEAGTDLARVAQAAPLAVALVVADHERADPPCATPLPGHPAADHDLLPTHVLDLEPLAAALAGPVGAVKALGDDPLQATLTRGGQEPGAVTRVVARDVPALA